jgi:hypothetical protein
VPWRVTAAEALPGQRLHVVFVDGTEGIVEMERFLADSIVDGTPFEALRNPAEFCRATVVLGAVEWPNGADLAPDAMYDAILQHGGWDLA